MTNVSSGMEPGWARLLGCLGRTKEVVWLDQSSALTLG